MLAFHGGTFSPRGLPEGCSGESSSGVFVAALRDEPASLIAVPDDVLLRLEREAVDAIAEAFEAGTGDESHVAYMKDVQRQCRAELARRKV